MITNMLKNDSISSRPKGYSLIEVLVAVLVLAIGLISVVHLQMTSKRSNFEAVQRASAAALVQDILERMRANPDELAVYTNAGAGRALTGTTMPSVTCSTGCTATQLASADLFQWEQAISGVAELNGGVNTGGLTLPTACISGPNGGSGVYTVALAWRGLTKLSNPADHGCGQGSGLYDHGAENDVHRRLLVVDTFIVEPI